MLTYFFQEKNTMEFFFLMLRARLSYEKKYALFQKIFEKPVLRQ